MKTVTIDCKKFEEWNEDVQNKILEKYSDINVNYGDWDDFTLDCEKEKLEKLGFYNVKISYSGFWSQGDGASFTGSIDIKDVKGKNPRLQKLCDLGLITGHFDIFRSNHHYSHENSTSISSSNIYYSYNGNNLYNIEKMLEDLEENLSLEIVSLNRDIYCSLEEDYDYLTSREAIIETINANEYEFDENGKIW